MSNSSVPHNFPSQLSLSSKLPRLLQVFLLHHRPDVVLEVLVLPVVFSALALHLSDVGQKRGDVALEQHDLVDLRLLQHGWSSAPQCASARLLLGIADKGRPSPPPLPRHLRKLPRNYLTN